MLGRRRRAREMAIQMLYQQELGGSSLDDVFSSFDVGCFLAETEAPPEVEVPEKVETLDENSPAEEDGSVELDGENTSEDDPEVVARDAQGSFDHARKLVTGTLQRRDELDRMIQRQAENWRLERMPTIDRNILRLAIYEMLYSGGVPKIVVVDEAIELAKKFGSEDSSRFVNGLLDGVLNSFQPNEKATVRDRGTTPKDNGGGGSQVSGQTMDGPS